jgi:hypothetical protein
VGYVSVEVGNFNLNRGDFNKESDRAMRRFVDRKAKELKRMAKMKVGVRSGKLRRSIDILDKTRVPGKFYSVSVGSRVSYAAAHHNGTGPYKITAKRNKVMKFKGGAVIAVGRSDGSGNIYARSVRHPRIAPNRYLTGPAKTIMTGRK